MKTFMYLIVVILISANSFSQTNTLQNEIDSLVEVLVKERRQWNYASDRLRVIGEPAVEELLHVLNNKNNDSWPRRKAAMTLSGINSEVKMEPCLKIYLDTSEEVSIRINACNAMQGVNLSKYENIFIKMSYDEIEKIRSAAYMRLGEIGTKKAIDLLISVVESEGDMTQWIILHRLESIETMEADQLFLKILIEDNWWMLDEFIANNLRVRGESVIDSLIEILDDPNNSDFLRWEAVWIIKDIESPKRIEVLEKSLKDKSFFVRNEAELALQKMQ